MRFLLALMLTLVEVAAATWYAGSSGTSTNGTSDSPWSVSYAVTNSSVNVHLQGGDTVLFKDGTFNCTETHSSTYGYDKLLVIRHGGATAGSKITYRPENRWSFRFNGGIIIPTESSNVVFRDFRISFDGMTNRTISNYTGYALGINHFSQNVDILHNLVENCGHPGIGSWSGTVGKNIRGNIIRFVGFDDYDQSTGTAAGSGMYLQNSTTNTALIQGNISYHNYTTGMKAYGNTSIKGFRFVNNIATSTPEAGLFFHSDQEVSDGVTIETNYLFGTSYLRLGYQLGNIDPTNAAIVGNVVAATNSGGPFTVQDGWASCIITNNTFASLRYPFVTSLETAGGQSNYVTTHTWNRNTYYAGSDVSLGTLPYLVPGGNFNFSTWQTYINGDANSVIATSAPPSDVIRVFHPSTDTNYVHVVAFSWATNATVSFNPTGYMAFGASVTVYDAQNVPSSCSNFTYTGGDVTLPMSLTNRSEMLGTFTNAMPVWSGFDPRFRAFVLYAEAPAGSATPARVSSGRLRKFLSR